MIANNIKKEIVTVWADSFTGLFVYAQNKLYKTCGAFILGIEIVSLPRTEEYRPIFVCYPLWKSESKQCFEESIFMQKIRNKKGFQFNIPYLKHATFFQEAIECTKKQVSILEYQNVPVEKLFEVFYRQFSQTLIKSSPVGQAKLFEAVLLCALYINDVMTIEKVWTEILDNSQRWTPDLFEWKFGKLDVWLKRLQTTISNRSEFLKQVELNRQDKKISELQKSELVW